MSRLDIGRGASLRGLAESSACEEYYNWLFALMGVLVTRLLPRGRSWSFCDPHVTSLPSWTGFGRTARLLDCWLSSSSVSVFLAWCWAACLVNALTNSLTCSATSSIRASSSMHALNPPCSLLSTHLYLA